MRAAAPVTLPVALTIAGSDSGGGAGIQADLKTMEALGTFGTSVVTATTAQNTRGVTGSHVVPTEHVEAQLDAVLDDFDVGAAKTGMLATSEVVEAVAARAADFDCPLVVDPVMVATSGDRLLAEAAEEAYEALVAEATVVTPNADEVEVLVGERPESEADARAAGEALLDFGARAALVKGGHIGSGDEVVDTLVTGEGVETFRHRRVDTDATHGSGCTLASAVAARLARGDDVERAVERATGFVARAVRYHHAVGEGPGAVHHLAALRERADRQPTAEAVEGLLATLREHGDAVRALVPEVGMNVVGASRYAESRAEAAAVEGRLTKTLAGVAAPRGVRFGASNNVARVLLAAREQDPSLRFAAVCRNDEAVRDALADAGLEVAVVDGETAYEEGIAAAFDGGVPDVVAFDAGVGREATALLLSGEAATLEDRLLALADALR
ncbi:bifunctional hydroxymethylpyrimidine kinase/phosphomethylpyrimidine kinase [Halomarina ordinaria]|uniref:Bifunctional hydroxymethylpyrimidine kinase/phosphomethylpyrimidine kinase n=1 Tax=Halomarina ordinaria TaxID=3033939 RepID=A0ABD5UDA0_9EURY|nr:bifunctional hydroxymethylpyrimidine kinase/phosphomethylpyrimidine kinase [Halomarina sp. PSRA2]